MLNDEQIARCSYESMRVFFREILFAFNAELSANEDYQKFVDLTWENLDSVARDGFLYCVSRERKNPDGHFKPIRHVERGLSLEKDKFFHYAVTVALFVENRAKAEAA